MPESTQLSFTRPAPDTLQIALAGEWVMRAGVPSSVAVEQELTSSPPRRLEFDARQLAGWDSALLTFLVKIAELCAQHGITADRSGLPTGVRRLLDLSEAVPERPGARDESQRVGMLARVGLATL